MAYWMYKVDRDLNVIGNGDSGQLSEILWRDSWADNTDLLEIKRKSCARPRVGVVIRVGSMHSRSYSRFDYWQTSVIKEIVEETNDYVIFLTASGSRYLWKTL